MLESNETPETISTSEPTDSLQLLESNETPETISTSKSTESPHLPDLFQTSDPTPITSKKSGKEIC